jgi:hypothetical protein
MEPFGFPPEDARNSEFFVFIRDRFSPNQVLYPENITVQNTKPYVDVMLGAAYSILFFSPTKKEYNFRVDTMLTQLFEIIKLGGVLEAEKFSLIDFVNDGQSISGNITGFLACLACGVVCESYAQIASNLKKEHERDYESAFSAYIDEIKYLDRTGYTYTLISELFANEENIKQGKIQDPFVNAIAAWEQLKNKPDPIQNWRELRFYLDELYTFSDDNKCGPDELADFVYFPRQFSFCEAKLSQPQVYEILKEQQADFHIQRFTKDFLVNLWDCLEENAKERLIKAETNWYTRKHPVRLTSAFTEYAIALEIELRAILFRSVEQDIQRILPKYKDKNNFMFLSSPHAYSLYLSDMGRILGYLGQNSSKSIHSDFISIQRAISNLPISGGLKAFLTQKEFTMDLGDIYQIRNADVHLITRGLSQCSDLRDKLLGIGAKGYIANIAEIKKQLKEVLLVDK